jgi:L-asparaginase II
MTSSPYQPLVETTRGPIVESIHYGAAVVVNSRGETLFSIGDAQNSVYLRSSSKPLQVLPFVEEGGIEKYHLTAKEVAILCASHSGTDEHVATIEGIQKKMGFGEDKLMCGVHPPMHKPTQLRMEKEGQPYTPNRHMCSGKHSAFLAYAASRGLSLEDYINPEHPIQKTILATIAEMCDYPAEKIAIGVDGCSAPVFAMPLYNSAYAFARFCDPAVVSPARAAACQKIIQAMMSYPDMVAGPGRFDTRLMDAVPGKFMVKCGAEGYQLVAVPAGAAGRGSPALALALKISDGDSTDRAVYTATLHILYGLGLLNDEQIESLAEFYIRPLYNWRKLVIGEIRPCFDVPPVKLNEY